MAHRLDGARAKIDRAQEQLGELRAESDRFLGSVPFELFSENDAATGELVVRCRVRAAPPGRIAIISGEIVHGLRSALDHVVWQLVLANAHQPTSKTEFPVFADERRYAEAAARKIAGVSDEAAHRIRELQPFIAGQRHRDHALWLVHELDIEDKHHRLHVIGGALLKQNIRLGASGAGTTWFSGPVVTKPAYVPVADGGEILRVRHEGDGKPGVDMEFALALRFERDDFAKGRELGDVLADLVGFVRADVESFADLL